jgi:transketolase
MSAADVVAALFFSEMRYDPRDPKNPDNDRFVLSKGHAAPVLYAAWAEAGLFPRDELLKLRRIDSDLEGHPTPRLPFVDVATGSLGQGICAAIGIAANARLVGSSYRTYVILGDGESAEGSVWEAADIGAYQKLDNLCAIVDVNALGQSGPTQFAHKMDELSRRWSAFDWNSLVIDGHDMQAILDALKTARETKGRPTVILARTLKGKGVASIEGKEGWHGKALKKGKEADDAIAELEKQMVPGTSTPSIQKPERSGQARKAPDYAKLAPPAYKKGDLIATREAWGTALAAIGSVDERIVALDADVKNSTFSEHFAKAFAARFFENFIAEQVMVGMSMGLAARGAVPFASTFACFLSRAFDFIRMAGISMVNIKLTGSHAGISIGEDGPSQMALEDLAMMRAVPDCAVLYPCEAVSTERLVALMAQHTGMVYMRTSRPKTPVLYEASETFRIGGSKVVRQSGNDAVTIVGAGVTVFEALKAADQLQKDGIAARVIDAYSVQPIDAETLRAAANATRAVITVEDHYASGGLGDAVANALSPLGGVPIIRLAVREIPRSGQPEELFERYGISAQHIADAAKQATTKPAAV